jgi:hypothetical protein
LSYELDYFKVGVVVVSTPSKTERAIVTKDVSRSELTPIQAKAITIVPVGFWLDAFSE